MHCSIRLFCFCIIIPILLVSHLLFLHSQTIVVVPNRLEFWIVAAQKNVVSFSDCCITASLSLQFSLWHFLKLFSFCQTCTSALWFSLQTNNLQIFYLS
jgi:hypothetical protein